ncbi:hypothetical protein ACHAPD_007018 [Fusarium lateritium]
MSPQSQSQYQPILPAPDASGASGGQDPDKRCERWGTTCVYSVDHVSNVERELKEHRDVLELLLSLPADQALAAHRQLRGATNLTDVLSSLQGSMHGRHQPSTIRTAQAISPPTSSGLEFELTVRHGVAYPTLFPLDLASLSADPRLRPIQRSPGQVILIEGSSPSDSTTSPSTASSNSHATPSTLSFVKQEEEPVGPHRDTYCDERLHRLRIGYWTGVAIQDEVAARVISHYLQSNHTIFGFFDPNLFIHDLVEHRHEYCSSFLVNALLAHACQGYSVVDETVGALSQDFVRDAGVLWRAERSTDSLVNVASILMLSVSCHLQRSDIDSQDLLDDGRVMAERMKLFGVRHTPENAASFEAMEPDAKRATAHTAWGAYSYLTLNSFWVPTRPITFPPMFPVPGRNDQDVLDERLAVHWPCHFIPDYTGKTFQALCELWTIMQEVVAVYFAQQGATMRIPLAFVEAKYQKILSFTDSLPPEMSSIDPGNMSDHVLAFNILVHVAITNIFHPFIMDPNNEHLDPASLESPKAVLRASINQLQRLILISRLHHPKAHALSVLSSAVVHVSNTIIRDAALQNQTIRPDFSITDQDSTDRNPNWYFYFLVCLAACQDLGSCFPVFEPVGKGLLAMALRDGSMSAVEANRLMRALEGKRPKPEEKKGEFGSFVLDFDLEATKQGGGQVKDLAAQFEEFSMHSEFTEGGDFVVD